MNFARTLTAKASDTYDSLTFNSPDALYNDPAPDEFVAFIIGGVFSALGFVLWVRRLRRIRADIVGPLTGSLPLRTMLSALIDNDEPLFTIIKLAAQSCLGVVRRLTSSYPGL
jgi:drug/metabolite transporter (DMT)-like permease